MKQKGRTVLARIRKHFPHVNHVQDANKSIVITVADKDSKTSRKKDPENCALATACKRLKIADHAIIGIAYSWLIKGDVATRFKTSTAVGREITSFDRHQDFAADQNYRLSKVSEGSKLGVKPQGSKTGPRLTTKDWPKKIHHTANIRTVKAG